MYFSLMSIAFKKSIILFDGVCNLCNNTVQFVIKRDNKQQFLFASLQSDAAAKLLLQFSNKKIGLQSIVLIEDNKVYDKSTAALRIARKLNPLWNILYIFIIVPKNLRDLVYDYIAKHRYKWFGKQDSCILFIKEYKNRFIYN